VERRGVARKAGTRREISGRIAGGKTHSIGILGKKGISEGLRAGGKN